MTTCCSRAGSGQCIRFPVDDVRVFARAEARRACAASRMGESDRAISMAILEHVERDAGRARRLSEARQQRSGGLASAEGRRARRTSR